MVKTTLFWPAKRQKQLNGADLRPVASALAAQTKAATAARPVFVSSLLARKHGVVRALMEHS